MLQQRRNLARAWAVASVVAALASTVVASASARPGEIEDHCVVYVVDQREDGELVTTKPDCYATEEEAATARSVVPASRLRLNGGLVSYSSTWTIGIHYDGFNGTGSSISVVGSSCTGGWWNTPTSWDNRISSSYNGCYRLRHHDLRNKGGSSESTFGAGTTDNLSWMNNRTESVSYWSS